MPCIVIGSNKTYIENLDELLCSARERLTHAGLERSFRIAERMREKRMASVPALSAESIDEPVTI